MKLRNALIETKKFLESAIVDGKITAKSIARLSNIVSDALSESKGRWLNGKDYEYEFAYCSKCGRMQWAGWDTHQQAKEKIGEFYKAFKFCPECGSEMEGGEYVE